MNLVGGGCTHFHWICIDFFSLNDDLIKTWYCRYNFTWLEPSLSWTWLNPSRSWTWLNPSRSWTWLKPSRHHCTSRSRTLSSWTNFELINITANISHLNFAKIESESDLIIESIVHIISLFSKGFPKIFIYKLMEKG